MNINIIEKIKEQGYEIRECINEYTKAPDGFLEIRRGENPWKMIPKTNDRVIYFIGDNLVSSTDEAESLAKQGIIYKATANEIYAAFYNLDQEEQYKFRYGYGLKSRAYIESVMKEIELESIEEGANSGGEASSLPENAEKISYFVNASTYIGKVDNLWLVETHHRYEIDDFEIIKMWFSHKPTMQEIESAFAIERIEHKLYHSDETFRCWECGRTTHWTDAEGDIIEKVRKFEDKYCGC